MNLRGASIAFVVALVVATPARAVPPVSSGPDGITRLSRGGEPGAHYMAARIRGDRVYASVGGNPGLKTFDISDPTNPVLFPLIPSHPSWRTWIRADTLLSFNHHEGVQVFDISGGAPVHLHDWNPLDPAVAYEGGVLVGSKVYCAALHAGIEVLDLGLAGLSYDTTITLAEQACWDIEVAGNLLLVANGRFGLSVLDLAGQPTEVASLALPGLANDVEVDGDIAYVALGPDGIAAVDISSPASPVLLDLEPSAGTAWSMTRHGNSLFVGAWTCLEEWDVSNPSDLQLVGWEQTRYWALGAGAGTTTSSGDLVVVGDWIGIEVLEATPDAGPDIEVVPDRIDLGVVPGTAQATFEVRNTGGATLDVSAIIGPGLFAVAPAAFSVPPGQAQVVTLTGTGPGSAVGTLSIVSNDPDETIFDVGATMNNSTFPQIGSPAPFFNLLGTDGQFHTPASYQGRVVFLEFAAAW